MSVGVLVAVSATGVARQLTPQEKRSDLQQIASLVRSQYGPYELKKLDLDGLVARYTAEAWNLGNVEFYYLLNRFVAEFRDSHFRAAVKTSHVSSLGFVVDRIEGKVLIDTIDRRRLPPNRFPFQLGDEVVSFDGKPVAEVVDELARYVSAGTPATRLRLATHLLTSRTGTTVPPKSGVAKVTLKTAGAGDAEVEVSVDIPWRQEGEALEELPLRWSGRRPMDYLNIAVDDVFEGFPQTGTTYAFPDVEKGYRCSGLTRITPPEDAQVLMVRPFVAYIHRTEKGPVGYLRIPHYNWGKDAAVRLRQYEYIISELEQKTVGLVIDQDHNCGGAVTMLEDMVALFATQPFQGLQFRFMASRNEYLTFKSWVDDDERSTLAGRDVLQVLDLLKAAWLGGERMTPMTTFHGTRLKQPNSVRYTKPVLILIDELSGSGGDAFPSMMQGLGRAKLFGTRTMGAGGHVVDAGQLNFSGTTLRITKSLFYAPNGTPIENHGAVPDVSYTPTKEDFLDGYKPYRAAFLKELLKEIP